MGFNGASRVISLKERQSSLLVEKARRKQSQKQRKEKKKQEKLILWYKNLSLTLGKGGSNL